MSKRDVIYNKFNGLCAYSGTPLELDWQIEHILPVERDLQTGKPRHPERNHIDNLVPVQKLINHYKHSIDLETFRTWLLGGLHLRLAKLPKKSNCVKSIKRKDYILKVASYFDISVDKPFSGVFYFETQNPSSIKQDGF